MANESLFHTAALSVKKAKDTKSKQPSALTSVLEGTTHITRPRLASFVMNEKFASMNDVELAHEVTKFVTEEIDSIRS